MAKITLIFFHVSFELNLFFLLGLSLIFPWMSTFGNGRGWFGFSFSIIDPINESLVLFPVIILRILEFYILLDDVVDNLVPFCLALNQRRFEDLYLLLHEPMLFVKSFKLWRSDWVGRCIDGLSLRCLMRCAQHYQSLIYEGNKRVWLRFK